MFANCGNHRRGLTAPGPGSGWFRFAEDSVRTVLDPTYAAENMELPGSDCWMLRFHWLVVPLGKLNGQTPTNERPVMTVGFNASAGTPSRITISDVALATFVRMSFCR